MRDQKANQSENWHIRRVSETGSTNTDLLSEGAQGAPDRTVLRADYQSAGRGRLDRAWEAPRGANLLVSMLFRQVPAHTHVLTQAVALAAARVARDTCGVDVVMKWPNDLLVHNEKVAGILAQAGPLDDRGVPAFVVVGIGLNLEWAPPGATSLAASGWTHAVSPDEYLVSMLPVVDELLSLPLDEMHERYVAELGTVGMRVRAELPHDRHIVGRATGVEPDGRLIVLDECGATHRIDTADVVHLRPVVD
jgi:BirA family transcriptional regulator, biotin operon repressor / biotin---[acetyl-CoA-carboxylase] ligase